MYRLIDPATHPRPGDQVYAPDRAVPILTPLSITVREMVQASGGPPHYRITVPGYRGEDLRDWQFWPQVGDRVIVLAGPWVDHCNRQIDSCLELAGEFEGRTDEGWQAYRTAKEWRAAREPPWIWDAFTVCKVGQHTALAKEIGVWLPVEAIRSIALRYPAQADTKIEPKAA